MSVVYVFVGVCVCGRDSRSKSSPFITFQNVGERCFFWLVALNLLEGKHVHYWRLDVTA